MMSPKVTLISFPVDFGSVSLQNNFAAMLAMRFDLSHYIFSPKEIPDRNVRLSSIQRTAYRIGEIDKLRRACARARNDNRIVIFQQISPALYALPFLSGIKSYIFLDWTRKLYEPITHQRISSRPTTILHGFVLNSVSGILAFTDAAATSLTRDYQVPSQRIHRLPMPFDVLGTDIASPNERGPLRLLFVGGDFHRKGGEALVRWFAGRDKSDVELTIMTQSDVTLPPSVRLIRNDPKQSAKTMLRDHDLFVLPTKYDAFPLAIGEAASAGLGVVTSTNALGAPEVVDEGLNGHIVANDEQLFERLSSLARDRSKVESFKAHSRLKMLEKFTYQQVAEKLGLILTR